MFKDTLKNKYNKFGSIDDVVAKSKELDMAPFSVTVTIFYKTPYLTISLNEPLHGSYSYII